MNDYSFLIQEIGSRASEDDIHKILKEHLNTSFPATVVSYSAGRVKVKPDISKSYQDDENLEYAILNAKVIYPRFDNGSAGVKGRITKGTKGYVHIAQAATDNSGDQRSYDLSDAFFYPCDPTLSDPVGVGNDEMAMFWGAAKISISEDGFITIVAPTGFKVITPKGEFTAKLETGDNINVKAGGIDNVDGIRNTGGIVNAGGLSSTGPATSNGQAITTEPHTHNYTDDGAQKVTEKANV